VTLTAADVRFHIAVLADPIVARADKLASLDALSHAGLEAVLPLAERVVSLEDMVFLDDAPVPTGPMNAGAPRAMRVTARFAAEMALYAVIAPPSGASTSSSAIAPAGKSGLDALVPARGFAAEVVRPPIAWVDDWKSFARLHAKSSLAVIRAWSAAEIARLWHEAAVAGASAPKVSGPVVKLPVDDAPPAAQLAVTDAGALMDAWRDPKWEKPRAAYASARATFEGARKDAKARSKAKAALEAAAKAEPRLKPYVTRWLAALD
jgi:hypothetical protein